MFSIKKAHVPLPVDYAGRFGTAEEVTQFESRVWLLEGILFHELPSLVSHLRKDMGSINDCLYRRSSPRLISTSMVVVDMSKV